MTGPARFLLAVLGVITVSVVAVNLLAGDEGRGTLPAELLVTLVGAIAMLQLLVAVGRRWPEAWRSRPALVSVRRSGGVDDRLGAVREWEALLVTGTTGEQRGRDRLCRRLAALSTPDTEGLVTQIRTAPSNQVLELVGHFTTEVERTHDD